MIRISWTTCLAVALFSSAATAQNAPWQFRWQQGQILTYRVEHISSASETISETKTESKTQLNLTKRWQVLEVDATTGVATVQLALLALRLETTKPSGGTLLYDSANPDKSDPHMAEELARFVGQPLAVLRVDIYGRVIEVKESKHGPASRFEAEPPFVIVLPNGAPKPEQSWQRPYKIKVEPPQGTGDAYDAVQRYTCKSVADGIATVALTTALKTMPESLLDRVPLLQLQPEGEVVFDTQAGRLLRARLKIEKELTGQQGQGSTYRFQSLYTEEFAGDK
jgi:hypothetical protein